MSAIVFLMAYITQLEDYVVIFPYGPNTSTCQSKLLWSMQSTVELSTFWKVRKCAALLRQVNNLGVLLLAPTHPHKKKKKAAKKGIPVGYLYSCKVETVLFNCFVSVLFWLSVI